MKRYEDKVVIIENRERENYNYSSKYNPKKGEENKVVKEKLNKESNQQLEFYQCVFLIWVILKLLNGIVLGFLIFNFQIYLISESSHLIFHLF